MTEEPNTSSGSDPFAAPAAPRSITPEQRLEALRELNKRRSVFDFLWEWIKIFAVSVLLFAVIRTFFVEAFKIPSGSMENTLQVGDFLLVNKLVYGAEVPFTHTRLPRIREPQRGDVMVFDYPLDVTKNFVKRVVGRPGGAGGGRGGAAGPAGGGGRGRRGAGRR